MTAPVVIRDEADSWRWLANEARALIERAKAADINVRNTDFEDWIDRIADNALDAETTAADIIEDEQRRDLPTDADLRRMFPQE